MKFEDGLVHGASAKSADHNITIYVASSDTSEGTVSGVESELYHVTDWNADQTVTITGLRTIFPTATSPTRSV